MCLCIVLDHRANVFICTYFDFAMLSIYDITSLYIHVIDISKQEVNLLQLCMYVLLL